MNTEPTPGHVLHTLMAEKLDWRTLPEKWKARAEDVAAKFTAHVLAPINEALDAAGAPKDTFAPSGGCELLTPAERIAALVERDRINLQCLQEETHRLTQELAKAKAEIAVLLSPVPSVTIGDALRAADKLPPDSPLAALSQDPEPQYRDLVPLVEVIQAGDQFEAYTNLWQDLPPHIFGTRYTQSSDDCRVRRPIKPPVEDQVAASNFIAEFSKDPAPYKEHADFIAGLQADLITARNRIHVLERPWKKIKDGKPTEEDGDTVLCINADGECKLLDITEPYRSLIKWDRIQAWMPLPKFTP